MAHHQPDGSAEPSHNLSSRQETLIGGKPYTSRSRNTEKGKLKLLSASAAGRPPHPAARALGCPQSPLECWGLFRPVYRPRWSGIHQQYLPRGFMVMLHRVKAPRATWDRIARCRRARKPVHLSCTIQCGITSSLTLSPVALSLAADHFLSKRAE
jgi:hypothetical protein